MPGIKGLKILNRIYIDLSGNVLYLTNDGVLYRGNVGIISKQLFIDVIMPAS